MSVIIKGVEAPLTCGACKLKYAIDCDRWERVRSVALDRHQDCPITPVPPHGKLIDVDALRDSNYDVFEIDGADGTILAMDISIIDAAPTFLPASEEGV